jgi:competence protein ComEC
MKHIMSYLVLAVALLLTHIYSAEAKSPAKPPAKTLTIYFIDVEGGQATLIVTPARQSLLIDTGFPGNGTFQSRPGDPEQARDARRIVAAANDAGLDHIDYLLITHFHADHAGGAVELAQLIPIYTFVDHGEPLPEADETATGTLDLFHVYRTVRAKGRRIEPKPGDRLPLKGVDTTIVSTAGQTLSKPLRGTDRSAVDCSAVAPQAQEPHENPRSTGIHLRFGKFTFLDLGDLSGAPLRSLACPRNLVGPVDVYLIAHHGGADAADTATLAAFNPQVTIFNNGATKGGAPSMFKVLRQFTSVRDVWQLHRSTVAGSDNFADERIANLDESTAHWIKLSANADGSFQILNARTGATKVYERRKL